MRILILNGAPRRHGYSRDLIDLFASGVEGAGGEAERIDLARADLEDCRGCFSCWDSRRDGSCVIRDGMAELIERYLAADAVVMSTPVYFYGFSVALKRFIERLFPLSTPRPDYQQGKPMRNALRHPEKGPRTAALLAVAAHRAPETLNPLTESFTLIANALGLRPAGVLLRPESFFLDFPQSNPKLANTVRKAFVRAGEELANAEMISAETQRRASSPLSPDDSTFAGRFCAYWEIAGETDLPLSDRKALAAVVGDDLRILMADIARHFDADEARSLEAVFQFSLAGAPQESWYLEVRDGKCRAVPGTHESPTVTVTAESQDFVDIARGRKNPRDLIARGELKITGDRSLFAKFARLFPRPKG